MSHALPRGTSDAVPETILSVPGLKCASCIAKLEKGLNAVPGVMAARVNFSSKRVTVSHASDLSPPKLQEAVEALGFENHFLDDALGLGEDQGTADLVKALAVAGFAAMNIMLLSVSIWSGAAGATRDLFHWLSAAIALPTVAYSGRPFFKSAWTALRHGRTNMDVPISIGVTLATGLSLFETAMRGHYAYFDGAVMLLFFLLTGRVLDSMMRDRARDGISALTKQMAPGALVVGEHGRSEWVPTARLVAGMTILVAAGERLAADGVVSEGESQLDISLLTGESSPVEAKPGTEVHAGTLNLAAPLWVRVIAVGTGTALSEIARLMDEATQSKSRYVRVADRAASLYAPAVHSLALLSFLGWIAAGAGWHQALLIAVAVLIITCPCALGLAVPAAQVVAVGGLMRKGVLVKDGSALERLAEADFAMFDKTGTLTLGRPVPVNLETLSYREKSVLLGLCRNSRHPLSEALRRSLEALAVAPCELSAVEEIAGLGIRGKWDGRWVLLGRPPNKDVDGIAAQFSIENDGSHLIAFADQLRPDAAETIGALDHIDIPAVIVSGDRRASVAPVARSLGITALTDLMPADKVAAVERQALAGRKVLMVGDGMNDGPALASGHVSMAPASASDAGQNAADAVFLGDSLYPVVTAIRVARETKRVVHQNFIMAIGYNALAVPLAIAGLVTPLIAAVAMSGSSLLVVANAMRLRWAAK